MRVADGDEAVRKSGDVRFMFWIVQFRGNALVILIFEIVAGTLSKESGWTNFVRNDRV